MRQGLKMTIFSEIQQRGVISYSEAEQIAKDYGAKIDNMTRRLRELIESGSIEPVRNKKRIITHYRFIGEQPKVKIQSFPQISIFQAK